MPTAEQPCKHSNTGYNMFKNSCEYEEHAQFNDEAWTGGILITLTEESVFVSVLVLASMPSYFNIRCSTNAYSYHSY